MFRVKKIVKSIFIIVITTVGISTMLHALEIDFGALPDHGYGFLERLKNDTEYPLSIFYEKHPTHDAMPEESIVRIKSLKTGKYFTLRKDTGGLLSFKADTTDPKDRMTNFTVHHRISANLQPWLGLAHPTANNSYMRVHPDTKMAVFDTKEFMDENAQACHWEIKGDSIDNCFLINRGSQGPLAPYNGKVGKTKVLKEKTFEHATALWALSYKERDDEIARINAQYQAQINAKRQELSTLQGQINSRQPRIDAITAESAPYPVGSLLAASTTKAYPPRTVYFADQNFGYWQHWEVKNSTATYLMLYSAESGGYFCVHPPKGWPGGNCNCDGWPEHESGLSCERLVWTAGRLGNWLHDAPAAGAGPYAAIKFVDMANGEEITTLDKLTEGRIVAIYSVWKKYLKCYFASWSSTVRNMLKAMSDSRSENWCQFRIRRDGKYVGIQLVNPYQTELDNYNNLKARVKPLNDAIAALEQERTNKINAYAPTANADALAYSGSWKRLGGWLTNISVQNDFDGWGCTKAGDLYNYRNGSWNKITIQKPIKNVSVSSKGDVWCVDQEQTTWVKSGTGFSLAPQPDGIKIIQLSVRNENEVWGIGTDNIIYKFDGAEWKKRGPNIAMLHVSAAEKGAVWAVDKEGKVWQFEDQKKWKTIPCDVLFKQIEIRNDQDVYAISKDDKLFNWNGSAWKNISGYWSWVAVASGVTEIAAVTTIEYSTFEGVSTQAENGKPLPFDDSSRVQFEIVKLGMGGGLPPQSAGDYVKIPVTKNPRVTGFAKDRSDEFDAGSLLNVNPLLTKGAAWLETSLATPGAASVAFLARAKDTGDIQIVFGQEINDSYVWRVIIGGWKNTKSAIVKRRYLGNEPIDDVIYEVSRDQNPIAAALPGNFTPYWASIDDGLILVGMGEFGDNIFMSWRDPNPPKDVNRIGFSSHKQSVEYTQIQIGQPVVAKKPSRLYLPNKRTPKVSPISLSPSTNSFAWIPYTFRTADNGTVCFDVKGKEKVVLALGHDPEDETDHYAITFGDTNATGKVGISIKKWHQVIKAYREKSFLDQSSYPDIALDPNSWKKFWVSFSHGQIIVGYGDIGQNIITIFQDISSFDSIDAIGFCARGTTPAQIQNLQIASTTTLDLEKKEESYKRSTETVAFKGAVTFILPFDYKFSQETQAVKLEDLVNLKVYYPGATPQQGAFYSFMCTILANGAPKLDWTKAPENPQTVKVQRELTKLNASAELEKLKAEVEQKDASYARAIKDAEAQRLLAQGALDREAATSRAGRLAEEGGITRDLKKAEGDKSRMQYEAEMGTSRLMTEAGSQIIGIGSSAGPIGTAAATVVGLGLIGGGFAKGMLAENRLQEAAKKDFEGAQLDANARLKATAVSELGAQSEITKKQQATLATEQATLLEAQLKRKAIERETQAAQLTFNAKILEGEASFAFRGLDSYVYVDKIPERPELGSTKISQEAIDGRAKVLELLDTADAIIPNSEENLQTLIITCQKMLYKINHFYVINSQEIKQRIFENLDKINNAAAKYPQFFNDVINILFAAYNNSFLVDESKQDEAIKKDLWLNAINKMVRAILKGDDKTITLKNFFGEYAWLPQELPLPSKGTLVLEIEGNNDLLVCFASDFRKKTRNSDKDIYEIVIGGWDNSKASLRTQSLGKSVKEVSIEENPLVSLNPLETETFWFHLDNGNISFGKGTPGENVILSWKDPYPIPNLKYIGLSSWNSPIIIKNITVSQELKTPPPLTPKPLKGKAPQRTAIGTTKVGPDIIVPEEDIPDVDAIEKEIDEEITIDTKEAASAVKSAPKEDATKIQEESDEEPEAVAPDDNSEDDNSEAVIPDDNSEDNNSEAVAPDDNSKAVVPYKAIDKSVANVANEEAVEETLSREIVADAGG